MVRFLIKVDSFETLAILSSKATIVWIKVDVYVIWLFNSMRNTYMLFTGKYTILASFGSLLTWVVLSSRFNKYQIKHNTE